MKVITFNMYKGGVGKTTTSIALANELERRGYSILLIDLDGQTNLSDNIRVAAPAPHLTTSEFMLEQNSPDYNPLDFIVSSQFGNIDCIVSNSRKINDLDFQIKSVSPGGDTVLKRAIDKLSKVRSYDFVIIDTPGVINAVATNTYMASDLVLGPIQCQEFSITGIIDTYQKWKEIKMYHEDLDFRMFFTMVDERLSTTQKAKQVVLEILEGKEELILDTAFHSAVVVGKSQSARIPIITYDSKCRFAQETSSFTDEVLKRLGVIK